MNTRTIGLMITPGDGYEDYDIKAGTTVADLVTARNLHGRTITIDGVVIEGSQYESTLLDNVTEVWATGGAKGAQ